MIINWDTAVNPYKYPGKVKKVFYNQYILQRKKYTQWIGKISKKYDNSVDWWSTNTITRNPYISNAYKTICII